jgi:hypothetical protein
MSARWLSACGRLPKEVAGARVDVLRVQADVVGERHERVHHRGRAGGRQESDNG